MPSAFAFMLFHISHAITSIAAYMLHRVPMLFGTVI